MDIFALFHENADLQRGREMSAYMRNQFSYLGIGSVRRRELSGPFFRSLDKTAPVDWRFVLDCFQKDEREFAYLACEYLFRRRNDILEKDFGWFEKIALVKPWWDSIDSIAPVVGFVCKKYPGLIERYIVPWMTSDEKWLVRISIIFQLKYKKDTNLEVLTKAILQNSKTKEFFINKAIGWALREYSKTDAGWVEDFVSKNEMSNLSKREALKVINRKRERL
jgi:3-methyladenine DNA glycosylase AlkD